MVPGPFDTDVVTDDARLANQSALDYHPRHTFSTMRRLRLPLAYSLRIKTLLICRQSNAHRVFLQMKVLWLVVYCPSIHFYTGMVRWWRVAITTRDSSTLQINPCNDIGCYLDHWTIMRPSSSCNVLTWSLSDESVSASYTVSNNS